jgi:hypothetical protein
MSSKRWNVWRVSVALLGDFLALHVVGFVVLVLALFAPVSLRIAVCLWVAGAVLLLMARRALKRAWKRMTDGDEKR